MAKEYVLLNNTQLYNHLGCFYTSMGLKKLLAEVGYNCILEVDVNNRNLEGITQYLQLSDDVDIVINGEGTFHDDQDYAAYLLNFVNRFAPRVLLLNTQLRHMSTKYVDIIKKFKLVQVRTRYDYEWCESVGFKEQVYCPDMFFYSGLRGGVEGKDIIFTDSHDEVESERLYQLFSCSESSRWLNFHYLLPHDVISNRERILRRGLCILGFYKRWKYENWLGRFGIHELVGHFNSARLVVTGRYHAACLALLFEKPFFYARSNTDKIENLCSDFSVGMPIDKFGTSEAEVYINSKPRYDYQLMNVYKQHLINRISEL